jgi:hypothetical protein
VPNRPVRVEFRRSGGFAGIDMTATVDASELPTEQAAMLAQLMTHGHVTQEAGAAHGAADQFSYDVTLHDGQRTRTLHWTEADIPEEVKPVLASLTVRAKPAPPA